VSLFEDVFFISYFTAVQESYTCLGYTPTRTARYAGEVGYTVGFHETALSAEDPLAVFEVNATLVLALGTRLHRRLVLVLAGTPRRPKVETASADGALFLKIKQTHHSTPSF
jgi:hypothetical protein